MPLYFEDTTHDELEPNNIEGNLNQLVLASFSQKFTFVKEVSWNKTDKFTVASFKMNGQVMFAYFTGTGELTGTARNILSDQLPIKLQNELKKISDGWITELFEFATEDETVYYVEMKMQIKRSCLKAEAPTPGL